MDWRFFCAPVLSRCGHKPHNHESIPIGISRHPRWKNHRPDRSRKSQPPSLEQQRNMVDALHGPPRQPHQGAKAHSPAHFLHQESSKTSRRHPPCGAPQPHPPRINRRPGNLPSASLFFRATFYPRAVRFSIRPPEAGPALLRIDQADSFQTFPPRFFRN